MIRKILGAVGILVGLGLAVYFLFFHSGMVKPPAPTPVSPEQTQVAVSPAPKPSENLETSAGPQPPVPEPTPPVSAPAAAPEAAPAPPSTLEKPPAEQGIAPSPLLQPKKEPGLLVGTFRRYSDARKLLEKIKKQKIPAFIRKEGKYYKVWAGPFPTSEKAEQARKHLKAALKLSSKKGEIGVPVAK